MTGNPLAAELQRERDVQVAAARYDEWRHLRAVLGGIHFQYRGVPDYDTCAGCNQASGGWVPWPCPTWQAIEARGEALKELTAVEPSKQARGVPTDQ